VFALSVSAAHTATTGVACSTYSETYKEKLNAAPRPQPAAAAMLTSPQPSLKEEHEDRNGSPPPPPAAAADGNAAGAPADDAPMQDDIMSDPECPLDYGIVP
jgi:hypothetical protein